MVPLVPTSAALVKIADEAVLGDRQVTAHVGGFWHRLYSSVEGRITHRTLLCSSSASRLSLAS